MRALKEFLKAEGSRQREQTRASLEEVNAWQRSISRLNHWAKDRLEEADEDKCLRIEFRTDELREEGLGRYPVVRMIVQFFVREVEFIPISLRIAGRFESPNAPASTASGRVDLTNGIQKVSLYRFIVDQDDLEFGKDRWMFLDGFRDRPMIPLDRSSLDKTIELLLR
ncbi:MAG: hypothetical protein U0800_12930 [Isosphaeraceae bacterium]